MSAPVFRRMGSRTAWLLVLAAVPFYLFPSAARWPGLLFLPAAGLFGWWALRRPLPLTPLNPAVLLLAAAALASWWMTYDRAASLPKLAGVVIGAAVYFTTAAYARERKGLTLALAAFVLGGLLVGVLGLLGMFWSNPLYTKVGFLEPVIRQFPQVVTGLPGAEKGLHPNEVAGALLWVILPAGGWLAAILLHERTGPGSLLTSPAGQAVLAAILLAACLFLLGAFLLAQSRSAYIGLLGAALGCLLLSFDGRARRVALALTAGVGIALALLAAPLWPAIIEIISHSSPAVVDPFLSTQSFMTRFSIWSYGLAIFRDAPLTGIGMNTFRTLVFLHSDYPCRLAVCDLGHAHNEFLQAGLDLGAPGLVAFLTLYLGTFWMLVALYRRAGRPGRKDLALKFLVLGLGGGLLAHLFYGLLDAVALGAKPGILFWMLLGLVAGLHQQQFPSQTEPHHGD